MVVHLVVRCLAVVKRALDDRIRQFPDRRALAWTMVIDGHAGCHIRATYACWLGPIDRQMGGWRRTWNGDTLFPLIQGNNTDNQTAVTSALSAKWIPAFAGMTRLH